MDIQNTPGPDHSRRAYEQRQEQIDANRALVRSAREDLSAVARRRLANLREASSERLKEAEGSKSARQDAVELSSAARSLSEASPAEREARIRELAEAHRMERLHTPERIERAAQRLLEG